MPWDGDKNEYLTRERDGNPVIGVRQFNPNPEHCCEACVFGRGPHSEWCYALRVVHRDDRGQVTSDGHTAFQVWRQVNQWHVRRVGNLHASLDDAISALELFDDAGVRV